MSSIEFLRSTGASNVLCRVQAALLRHSSLLVTARRQRKRLTGLRHQKNTPLRSCPICAKSIFVIAEETNLKPCPVLFSVVTTT